MNCAACNQGPVHLEDSTGGVEAGKFVEEYECENCGATGEITGNTYTTPANWMYSGEVFRE